MSTLIWPDPMVWLAPKCEYRRASRPAAPRRNDLGWLSLCEDGQPAEDDLCHFGLLSEDDRRDVALIDPFSPYAGDRQRSRRMFIDDFDESSSESIW
ncbi:MAG TPA: hypothetical protein VN699_12195 [Pirellulales bacterium]|nr:hypothetical protein [Pirellulales bacterium]